MPEIVPLKVQVVAKTAVHPAGRRALGDRRRRRAGARRVRRPRLLPVVDQAEPGDGDATRATCATSSRSATSRCSSTASVSFYLTGDVAVAHPRADPAPALLLQPALAALRARAGRRDGRARRHRRRPRAARSCSPRPPRAALAAYEELLAGLEERFADVPNAHAAPQAGPPGRPRGAARTPPRPGSWSPATTAPGGTSSPCGPASTPTSRSATSPSRACGSAAARGPQRVRRLRDQPGCADGSRGRRQPLRRRGVTRVPRVGVVHECRAIAAAERRDLARPVLKLDPDDRTLCGGWTARDLLAHLLVRSGSRGRRAAS